MFRHVKHGHRLFALIRSALLFIVWFFCDANVIYRRFSNIYWMLNICNGFFLVFASISVFTVDDFLLCSACWHFVFELEPIICSTYIKNPQWIPSADFGIIFFPSYFVANTIFLEYWMESARCIPNSIQFKSVHSYLVLLEQAIFNVHPDILLCNRRVAGKNWATYRTFSGQTWTYFM